MKTKGVKNEAVADEFIKFARKNYGVAADDETYDKNMIWRGDGLASTIPGSGVESGAEGFTSVTEFPEDFSYTANIRSTIDGKPLGSLLWWPDQLANYDRDAIFTRVKDYYVTQDPFVSGIHDSYANQNFSIYPVPAVNFNRI